VLSSHDDFGGRATIPDGVDFATPNNKGVDCNGHGTHCAGTAAGGTFGVAYNAKVYSVRVLNCQGSGSSAGVISGFNWVGNNMVVGRRTILSASLGGGASQASDDAIAANSGKGVICVVAAGNDNANACNYSPARAPLAITVGATDKNDIRSSFSNFGTCVNIFAPGTSITSAWYQPGNTGTNTISGTSMACPHVAGLMAVLPSSVGNSFNEINNYIKAYATSDVVANAGTGSPNLFAYDRWDDGSSVSCK